jgi:hypothetical protein
MIFKNIYSVLISIVILYTIILFTIKIVTLIM